MVLSLGRARHTLPLIAAGTTFLFSNSVHAGPVEQLGDVAFGPGDDPVIVARYDNGGGGLIFADSRRSVLRCGSTYQDAAGPSRAPILILPNGTALVPTSRGVAVGELDGCSYKQEEPLAGAHVIDMVADPADPNAVIALCSSTGPQGSTSSLRRRSAEGQWTVLGREADDALATGLRAVLRDGRTRLYETALVPTQDEDAGDGNCDACPITAGQTTENEMFVLTPWYVLPANTR